MPINILTKAIFLFFWLVCSFAQAREYASEPQFPIELQSTSYNVTEGLSQSTVTSIARDHYGYTWFGTLNGLNRFDGTKFKQYFADKKSELPSSFIRSLKSNDKKLYIGTDKGLIVYDLVKDEFYPLENTEYLKSLPIWSLDLIGDHLYIGTENTLFSYDFSSKTTTKLTENKNFRGIKKVIKESHNVYLRTYDGYIYEVTNSEDKLLTKGTINLLQGAKDYGFVFRDNIWINSKTNFRVDIDAATTYDNDNIAYIKNSNISITNGITTKTIGKINFDTKGFENIEIHSLNGDFYITADNKGVTIIGKERNLIKRLAAAKNNVWSIVQSESGLFYSSDDTQFIKTYKKDFTINSLIDIGIAGPKHLAITTSHLYIGSHRGIHLYNIKTGKVKQLHKGSFTSISSDIDSNEIYAGTSDGKLLTINYLTRTHSLFDTKIENPIYDITKKNRVFYISSQSGLYEKNGDIIKPLYNDELVASLKMLGDILYFGTSTSIMTFSTKTNSINTIYKDQKIIYSMEISGDYIIAASSNNVIAYNSSNKKLINLSSIQGAQKEYNSQASTTLKGNVFLGGKDGISLLNIDEIEYFIKKRGAPITNLEELLIFNSPVINTEEYYTDSINESQLLKVKYSEYPLTIKFNAPNFSKNELLYKYRLYGLSEEWINSNGNHYATYTNLPPDTYIFEVYAIDLVTGNLGSKKVINIEITPPWWYSTSAKAVYIFIFVFLLYLSIKLILKRRDTQKKIAQSEERLKLSLWGSGDEMWDWDIESGKIFRSNIWGELDFPKDGQRSGLNNEESNIHPIDQKRVQEALDKHFYGETDHFEAAYRVKAKDGQWVWILDRAKIVERDQNDNALRMTGTIKNINNFKHAEEQLRLFERAIENISEGVFILDSNYRFVEVNEACCSIALKSRNYFIGQILRFDLYPEHFSDKIRAILSQQSQWYGEVEASKGDGSSFSMELTIDAIYDAAGELSHYVGVFSDISIRKKQEEELRKLTNTDLLTGLPNRSNLQVTLGHIVKRKAPHALMVLDIDNFKRINDSLGHQIGDELLIQIAHRIHEQISKDAIIYRLGGDEFAILVDNTFALNASTAIASRIIECFRNHFEVDNEKLTIGASIGIVLYPEDEIDEKALLRKADIAMYYAKSAGGNRYQFFSESLNKNAIKQLETENLIRDGLKDDLFEVYYQPKVNIKLNEITGMEALVRLNHPVFGLVPPNEFIPFAESNGLIVEIGDIVLRKACFAAHQWVESGLFQGRVAINLSSHQFALPDLVERIDSTLKLTKLPPKHLELEITEGTVIKNPEKAIEVMKQLADKGVHLALDDFGTGYSSLSYLKRFPIHTLKIDKSFVDDIDKSEQDMKMVDSIITIAHNMGLSVIGEGVEDMSQLNILKGLNCQEIQGFLFSKAIPHNEFSELLEKQSAMLNVTNIK
ncbi:EAL domain-containing protein [Shewanella gelidii]|uniref:Diguanylate cyclase n=1 Tax=Shewanella gelidii TaxID=1642821 RepID=A0A917JTM5_9GAMM|nr:EAL domain-containing protein [Shewanella gelidii]MCL1098226.1 EAL domain-containing protein [Shewanella gelidii]GGI83548.1 diguanylate cyclase [Shewanella gelidii]